jgi:hypothetical protein
MYVVASPNATVVAIGQRDWWANPFHPSCKSGINEATKDEGRQAKQQSNSKLQR